MEYTPLKRFHLGKKLCVCVCVCVNMHALCMYVGMYMCVYVYVCTYICSPTCVCGLKIDRLCKYVLIKHGKSGGFLFCVQANFGTIITKGPSYNPIE
jgi:hypothetical protein